MDDDSSKKTHLCIRCDGEVEGPARPSEGWDYIRLAFNQHRGELPICEECFEEVKDRDVRSKWLSGF